MECNKDEAIRAKDIAEKKMQLKDYIGAQKIALKAQKLFPDLENISHMVAVCQVHLAASVKTNGLEDWYGVLQVESTSDELYIKKQYRKLALLLHPDKNKFPGAEAAFKLVGEAHKTLSDQARRSQYDRKRTAVRFAASRSQSNGNNFNMDKKFRGVDVGTKSTILNQKKRSQQAASDQTFWTICTFCSARYEYFRNIMFRNIRCQNCRKTFLACELKMEGVSMRMNQPNIPGQDTCKTNQQCHTVNTPFSTGLTGNTGDGSRVSELSQVERGDGVTSNAEVENENHDDSQKKELNFQNVELKVNNGKKTGKPSVNSKQRSKGKKVVQSGRTDKEQVLSKNTSNLTTKDADTSKIASRRSTRQKRNISYDEDTAEDDAVITKRWRKDTSSQDATQNSRMSSTSNDCEFRIPADGVDVQSERKGNIRRGENMWNGHIETMNHDINQSSQEIGNGDAQKVEINSSSYGIAESNPDICNYPDSEFFDFEKRRNANAFAVDQIWALFDDIDGMPRYYSRIDYVFSPGFKVQYTWLDHVTVSESAGDMLVNELPVSCGAFEPGITNITEELTMFSHPMPWVKIGRRNHYLIQPRKDEIWALYKGWDVNWSSSPENHKPFEYEMVLILSDYSKVYGISVVPLIKVESFVSLFTILSGASKVQIPPNEMLRFSHLVPSYKMTGNEREGVPEGFYELDPGSLPFNFVKIFPSISLDLAKANIGNTVTQLRSSIPEPVQLDEAGTFLDKERISSEENILGKQPSNIQISTEDSLEIDEKNSLRRRNNTISKARKNACSVVSPPKPLEKKDLGSVEKPRRATRSHRDFSSSSHDMESHDFQAERSYDKFRNRQIWATYSDVDHIPKRYALIKSIKCGDQRVRVIWLEACPESDMEIKWFKKDLTFGCGMFKHSTRRFRKEADVPFAAFSHLMSAEPAEKINRCYIYPRIGEVWAIYRNWSADWQESDLASCEYDLVEVMSNSSSKLTVWLLVKVKSFESVFTYDRNDRAPSKMDIPRNEWLRFSHRVPSHRLTNAGNAMPKVSWELDTASMPRNLACRSE